MEYISLKNRVPFLYFELSDLNFNTRLFWQANNTFKNSNDNAVPQTSGFQPFSCSDPFCNPI